MTDWKEQMCANIKTRRKALGLNQAQAGERAGTNQAGWGHWETGRRVPTIDNLYTIAEALECTLYDLLPESRGAQ